MKNYYCVDKKGNIIKYTCFSPRRWVCKITKDAELIVYYTRDFNGMSIGDTFEAKYGNGCWFTSEKKAKEYVKHLGENP